MRWSDGFSYQSVQRADNQFIMLRKLSTKQSTSHLLSNKGVKEYELNGFCQASIALKFTFRPRTVVPLRVTDGHQFNILSARYPLPSRQALPSSVLSANFPIYLSIYLHISRLLSMLVPLTKPYLIIRRSNEHWLTGCRAAPLFKECGWWMILLAAAYPFIATG